MEQKTLTVLEFPRVLEALASHTSFSVSHERALLIQPTTDIGLARTWQKETTEARQLLDLNSEITLGGVVDIRVQLELCARGGVLIPTELLDVKNTLIAARTLLRALGNLDEDYPALAAVVLHPPQPYGIIDGITRCISEHGDILDAASEKLAATRREVKIAHERLMSKLQRFLGDSHTAPMLQEGLITQRDGRYVLPLRAEFKGQIKAIVHDQSSSGATLFIEPLVVVELNNRYKELQLEERDEERRVLAMLSGLVGEQAADIIGLLDLLADLDMIFARARYAESLRAVEPVLHAIQPAASGHPGSVIRLYQARHPLLDPQRVVPIDLLLDEQTFILIITGPNTGGKTVTLKTLGLFALMAQAGLHLPAQSGTEISVFQKIFADIGDEQSIEQSLSTFSGHITNIIHLLKSAGRESLVLLDELGAGTDPQEGAALAMAILKDLLERGITSLVATHYPELKTFAHNTPAVTNASLEFDLKTLRPTYRLTIGLPGRSNALAIAERLGLPERIITAARSTIHPDELKAEDLLDEIYHQRNLAREDRQKAENHRVHTIELEKQLAARLKHIEQERQEMIQRTRQQMDEEIARFTREAEELKRELARARQPLEVVKSVQTEITRLVDESAAVSPAPNHPPAAGKFSAGSKVMVTSLHMPGKIISITAVDAEVLVGNLRIRARLADLQLPDESEMEATPIKRRGAGKVNSRADESRSAAARQEAPRQSPGMELDIRGQRAEDGLDLLDRYIAQAYQNGMPFVRIIHGKGTGRLRQVIREELRSNPQVYDFESGMDNEGGDGVTIARLKQE
jgi:DNA mismatch repair protein MutS2